MTIHNFVERVCKQKAIYWGSPTPDGFGQNTFDDPVEISVRWEDKKQVITDAEGKEVTSGAQIFSKTNMEEQGFIYLGKLSDLTDSQKSNPLGLSGAREIKVKGRSPQLGSVSKFLNVVYV